MYKETRSELFIRLLSEAFEIDRMAQMNGLSRRSRTHAKRYRELFLSSGRNYTLGHAEPQDCVQMMSGAMSEQGFK